MIRFEPIPGQIEDILSAAALLCYPDNTSSSALPSAEGEQGLPTWARKTLLQPKQFDPFLCGSLSPFFEPANGKGQPFFTSYVTSRKSCFQHFFVYPVGLRN